MASITVEKNGVTEIINLDDLFKPSDKLKEARQNLNDTCDTIKKELKKKDSNKELKK